MKSLKLTFFFLIAFIGNSYTTKATHLMGAQIWYKNIGKYKYEVHTDFYRDCRGVTMSAPKYSIKGTGCSNTGAGTFKLISITNITPVCASAGQVCYPPNTTSSSQGYEKHSYIDTIDLSSFASAGCCQVQIGTGQCCRSSGITTGASGNDFWIWCMIDVCKSATNSSPNFLCESTNIISCNQPIYSSITAVDYTDNDSLVYELTDPMTNWTTKTSWSGGKSSTSPFSDYWPIGYNKSNGPNPNANPPIGTYFDPTTGGFIFTPADCSESTISAVRIKEYRKDSASGTYVLLGYIIRDWQTWVINGQANNPPSIGGPTNLYFADSVESSFIFNSYDNIFIPPPPQSPPAPDTVKLKMYDFTPLKSNNSTFKIINPTKINPSAKFTWKPMGMKNSKPYLAMLEARDNACTFNGFYPKAIKVYVKKKADLARVEGIAFNDINKNCKRDSSDNILAYSNIYSINSKSVVFVCDSNGYFSGWLPPGSYAFKVSGNGVSFACSTSVTLSAGNSYKLVLGALGPITVTGMVYNDSIKNCKADTTERRLKNHMVYSIPGNYASTTDSKGNYSLSMPAAEYKLFYKPKHVYNYAKCPSGPININYNPSQALKGKDFGIFDTTNISELSVSLLASNNYRRGFNSTAYVLVKNEGTQTVSSNVWIRFNKKLNYSSSSSYAFKSDSTLKFSFSNLKPDEELKFVVVLKADTGSCKLGDTMTSRVWLDTAGMSNDFVKTNNYYKQSVTIVAAVDPNSKEEHNTNGYAWRDGNKLRYFVQFQNTGKDTAVNIKVVDSLHYSLLGQTFQFIGASHAFDYSLNSNVLTVNFPNIYLVDTSKSKEKSIGFFEFTVDIDPKINKEFKFFNFADIYFDFAKPVRTNKKYITYTSLVKAGPTDRTTYCGTDTITVAYSSKFSFNSGNKFKVMMSDSLGNFTSATKFLDSVSTSSPNGKLRFAIPKGTVNSNLYKIKIISTNPSGPVYEEALSNSFALVSSLSKPTFSNMNQLYCGKDSIQLNINSSYKTFNVYEDSSYLFTANKANPKIKLKVGKHTIIIKAVAGSCSVLSDTLRFANDTLPIATLSTSSHSSLKVCGKDSVSLEVGGGHSAFELLGNSLVYLESFNSNKAKVVIPNNNDERTAKVTSALGCSNNSNTLKFTNIKKPTFTFTDSDADNELCKDDSVKFSVTGNNTIKFQLYKNNTAWLKKFRPSIISNDIKDGDLINVMGTDTITGCADTSAPIKFGVTYFSVGLTCSDTDLIICSNVNITFKMSGASTYKLYKNNKFWTTPSTNPITLFGITNNDEIYAEGTTKACKYNSNKLKFKVKSPPIGLKIENSCIGDSLRLSFSGGVSYDLYKNSTFYKTFTTKTFASKDFVNNDKIYLEGFDSFGCTNYSPTITVNYSTPPNISLTNPDTDNTTCRGENVTFNFSGGVSYNLFKNNSLWKSVSGNTITFNDAKDQDEFYTVGYNSTGCPNTSAKIKLTVKTPNFVLTTSDPDNTICPNESITLSFSGGTKYDIYKNNTLLTANAKSPYTLNFIQDKDKVYMLGTGSNGCTDTSQILEFKVLLSPNFTVKTDSIVCDNENVVLDFSGTSFYNLYKNNTLIKTNISTPYKLNLKDKDILFIEGVSDQGCKIFSRNITYKVLPSPLIKIMNPDTDNSHCKVENVVINFSGGATYDLFKNNVIWKINTGNSVTFNDATDKDEIYSVGLGSNGCSDTSNKIKFTVWPIPTKPSITKSGTVLSSSYPTGNQWYEGTSKLTGATAQTYSPVKTATYFVEHTDANGCLSPLSDGFGYSVSISKIKLKGLKIYPNPASDYLIIETGESGKFHLSLIDITGKLVKEESFTGNRFEWLLKPAKGIYTLKIVNEKGESENVVVEFK